jgi:hypothetical protein
MADLQTIDQFISDASLQAAAWYSVLTNRPAVVPGMTTQAIAVQQQAGVIPPAPLVAPALVVGGTTIDPWLLVAGAVLLFLLLKE